MENKILAVVAFFAIVLFGLSTVSAVSVNNFSLDVVEGLPPTVVAGGTYSVVVNFTNSNSNYTSVGLAFSSDFELVSVDNPVNNDSVPVPYTLNVTVPATQGAGSFDRTLTVEIKNGSNVVDNLTLLFSGNVPEVSFCEEEGYAEVGDLDIYDFAIDNLGEGDDDTWHLLDKIEIEVEVRNLNYDDSVSDVRVKLKIMKGDEEVTDEFEFDDSEKKLGKIKKRDTETVLFVINEIPMGLDEDDYKIYVMVYSDGDEENQCISKDSKISSSGYYAEIEVKNDFEEGIIMPDFLENLDVVCGQKNVELVFDVYNFGDDSEKRVLVQLYNSKLGIDERIILNSFGSGDSEEPHFLFDMPEELSEDYYYLDIITYWEWDNDLPEDEIGSYDSDSDNDLDGGDYRVRLDILSCSVPEPIINAELISEVVIVGTEVVVKVSVTNPAEDGTFAVSVNGYDSWAKLVSVEPSVLILDAGESGEVLVKLKPTAEGIKNFNVRVVSNDNDVSREVSLTVGASVGLFDFGNIGGDVMYWVAGVLIVLIVLLFILILVFAARRR